MKKFVILFLAILLISTFALAIEDETLSEVPGAENETSSDETPSEKIAEIKDKVSSTKLGDIGDTTKEKAGNILDKNMTIPSLSIFGIEDGELTLQQLIVFVIFMILTFIIFLEIAIFLPFLDHKIISGDIIPFEITLRPIFALILTLVPAVTGDIYSVSDLFYSFISTIEIIGKLGALQIFLWVALAIILFIIFSWTAKKMKQGKKLEKAEEFGERVKQVDAINRIKIAANK